MKKIILITLCFFVWIQSVYGYVYEWTPDKEVLINVGTDKPTHIIMPKGFKPVKLITGIANYLSAVFQGRHIFVNITRRDFPGGDVYVVAQCVQGTSMCEDGTAIFHFVLKHSETPDEVVRLVTPAASMSSRNVFPPQVVDRWGGTQKTVHGELTPLRFLKAILWGPLPPGVSEKKVDPPKVVFNNGRVEMTLYKIYSSPRWVAYVVVERNVTNRRIYVPVQRIWFPGLVMVRTTKDFLNPGEYDVLIFVAQANRG